jgi:hypothetical protein
MITAMRTSTLIYKWELIFVSKYQCRKVDSMNGDKIPFIPKLSTRWIKGQLHSLPTLLPGKEHWYPLDGGGAR